MRVAITGSHGLIGTALAAELERRGNDVVRVARGAAGAGALDGCHAVVNLAGSSIAKGRWSTAQKKEIMTSRVLGTQAIVGAIGSMADPPQVLLSASATGFYGDRGDEILTEAAARGRGFRAEVCHAWEDAATAAAGSGVRVVLARSGIVLDPRGGILPVFTRPFRAFVGGPFGNGHQFVPWISIQDEVRALIFSIENAAIEGPVNLVAPNPATNREFAAAIGEAIGKPANFKAPRWAIRLVAGTERANEILFSSQRAVPQKLLNAGFEFRLPEIREAMHHLLREEAAV